MRLPADAGPNNDVPVAFLAPWVCGECLRHFDPIEAELLNICPRCRHQDHRAWIKAATHP